MKKCIKIKFTPGERMVFHHWENEYQPTKDYQNLFNNPWCPLFGVLPFNNSLAKELIQHLRTFFGIPLVITNLCPEAYPDPKVIFELTGFSQAKLSLTRTFFIKCMQDAPYTNDENNDKKLVNIFPLIDIARVWSILKLYYIDDHGKHAEIFNNALSKVAVSIKKNSESYAFDHGNCEVATKERAAREFHASRTDASRSGKLAAKKICKEKVRKSFVKISNNSSVKLSTINCIANNILEDLKRSNEVISLNTVKSYLREFDEEKVICLPRKKTSHNL